MPKQVVMGAMMQCTMGLAPSSLVVVPKGTPVFGAGVFSATTMDHMPMMNIVPFGMCKTPANPMVAAATTAALGVLTPMPCIPVTVSPWVPGATKVTINGSPALHDGCKLTCMWGGSISITSPGQAIIDVT